MKPESSIPGNTKRKRRSKSNLGLATDLIKHGNLTKLEAAVKYNIPRSTLDSRLRKDGYFSKKKFTANTVLPPSIESEVLSWIHVLNDIGFASITEVLPSVIRDICELFGEHTLFPVSNLCSEKYCAQFIIDKDIKIDSDIFAKANSSKLTDQWIDKFKNYLESKHSLDAISFLKKSNSQVFCFHHVADVTKEDSRCPGVLLKPTETKISNANMHMMSAYSCISGSGDALKPLVLFKFRGAEQKFSDNHCSSSFIIWSRDANLDTDSFMDWLLHTTVCIAAKGLAKPYLFLIDQSIRSISISALKFCKEHSIILFYLPYVNLGSPFPFSNEIFIKLSQAFESNQQSLKSPLTIQGSLRMLSKNLTKVINKEIVLSTFSNSGLIPLSKKNIAHSIKTAMQEEEENSLKTVSKKIVPRKRNRTSSPTIGVAAARENILKVTRKPTLKIFNHITQKRKKQMKGAFKQCKQLKKTESSTEETLISRSSDKPAAIVIENSLQCSPTLRPIPKTLTLEKGEWIIRNLDYQAASSDRTKPVEMKCNECIAKMEEGRDEGVKVGVEVALISFEEQVSEDLIELYRTRYKRYKSRLCENNTSNITAFDLFTKECKLEPSFLTWITLKLFVDENINVPLKEISSTVQTKLATNYDQNANNSSLAIEKRKALIALVNQTPEESVTVPPKSKLTIANEQMLDKSSAVTKSEEKLIPFQSAFPDKFPTGPESSESSIPKMKFDSNASISSHPTFSLQELPPKPLGYDYSTYPTIDPAPLIATDLSHNSSTLMRESANFTYDPHSSGYISRESTSQHDNSPNLPFSDVIQSQQSHLPQYANENPFIHDFGPNGGVNDYQSHYEQSSDYQQGYGTTGSSRPQSRNYNTSVDEYTLPTLPDLPKFNLETNDRSDMGNIRGKAIYENDVPEGMDVTYSHSTPHSSGYYILEADNSSGCSSSRSLRIQSGELSSDDPRMEALVISPKDISDSVCP